MDDRNIQDRAIDESTDAKPQVFDEAGYVVGHAHHESLTQDDLEAFDDRLAPRDPVTHTDEFGSTPRAIRHHD